MKRALAKLKQKYGVPGIKGKIVKKIEEKRSRSQSMPVVPKGPYEARVEDDREDDDLVERAEEACPETMAFEQVNRRTERLRVVSAVRFLHDEIGIQDAFSADSSFPERGSDRQS